MEKEQSLHQFILVDDSKMDLFLIEKLLKMNIPGCTVKTFEQPDKALDFFREFHPDHPQVVLLDINMPVINGFEFLDAFDKLHESQKKQYSIYILTSSHNVTDIERGKANPYVKRVLHKPLDKDTLLNLL